MSTTGFNGMMVEFFDDPDEHDDAATQALVEGLRRELERWRQASCVGCARVLCGHEVLFSVALGLKDAPRCLQCLAAALERPAAEFRDELAEYVRHRDCYRQAWATACEQEGLAPTPRPPCLWNGAPANGQASAWAVAEAPAAPATAPIDWDAGDMSCGDLVLALRIRLQGLAPGALLRVTARDPAAPEDLPAWCRLTGHRLVEFAHPHYLIQRKER